jgi:hypothetical protein
VDADVVLSLLVEDDERREDGRFDGASCPVVGLRALILDGRESDRRCATVIGRSRSSMGTSISTEGERYLALCDSQLSLI